MYDFSLTDEQELLLEAVDQFIEQCKSNGLDEKYFQDCWDENRDATEYWDALVQTPFMGLGAPEEFGGTPVDIVTQLLVFERFQSQGYPFNSPALALEDTKLWGNAQQLEMVSKSIQEHGTAFALGISEPGAGSDDSGILSTATRRDGKIYLNGHKTFITNADRQPYIMFVTRDQDNPNPHKAMTMWLVDMKKPGITLEHIGKVGQRLMSCYDVYFEDVEVEESDMFGPENGGFMQLVKNFEIERLSMAIMSVAQAEYCYNTVLPYAAQREQFGQPIGNFQLVQELLFNMKTLIDSMRWQVYHAAWMKDQGESIQAESGYVKVYCANKAFEVCDMAMQVLGGIGYTYEMPVARMWADSRLHRIGGGTDQIVIHSTMKAIIKKERKRQGLI